MKMCFRLTAMHYWQGEERDSSDEEWEAAYATLDPIGQLGWVNRMPPSNAVGPDLVRDVFTAADEMHDHAMSEMGGNTQSEERDWGGDPIGGEASTSYHAEGRNMHSDNEEVATEGEQTGAGICGGSCYSLFSLHTCSFCMLHMLLTTTEIHAQSNPNTSLNNDNY